MTTAELVRQAKLLGYVLYLKDGRVRLASYAGEPDPEWRAIFSANRQALHNFLRSGKGGQVKGTKALAAARRDWEREPLVRQACRALGGKLAAFKGRPPKQESEKLFA